MTLLDSVAVFVDQHDSPDFKRKRVLRRLLEPVASNLTQDDESIGAEENWL